jgi:hypothetical protein
MELSQDEKIKIACGRDRLEIYWLWNKFKEKLAQLQEFPELAQDEIDIRKGVIALTDAGQLVPEKIERIIVCIDNLMNLYK